MRQVCYIITSSTNESPELPTCLVTPDRHSRSSGPDSDLDLGLTLDEHTPRTQRTPTHPWVRATAGTA